MAMTRREFAIATGSVVAMTVMGCDGQADPAPQAEKGKESHKANLATEPFQIGPRSRYTEAGVYADYKKEKGVWVVSDGVGLVVFSATCTHLGCSTDLDPEKKQFDCPCHESRFDFEGINQSGSKAKRPLERCALKLVGTGLGEQVEVDPTRRFRKDRDQWSDPASRLGLS